MTLLIPYDFMTLLSNGKGSHAEVETEAINEFLEFRRGWGGGYNPESTMSWGGLKHSDALALKKHSKK